MSARDRLRQFREATRLPTARDYELARRTLTPELFALFEAQHPRDIVHAAATAQWLVDRGHAGVDLVTAALLHDIGKGEQRRIDRVAYVLASHARVAAIAGESRSRLAVRRAIARSLGHSEIGAAAMERAGASARAVELARLHHSPPGRDAILRLLQAADAAS